MQAVLMKSLTNMQVNENLSLEVDDYCKNCGGRTSMIVEFLGKKKRVKVTCKCEMEQLQKEKELERQKEKQVRLDRLRDYSLMDKNFKNCTFHNFKVDADNKSLHKIAQNYCANWAKMKEENVGMLLMGDPGIGKTYLSFCIANKLIEQLVPVIAISTISLINKVYESYRKNGEEGETAILNSLQNADLLILDDLGAEYGKDKSKQLIYSVIDSRIRHKKPLIITTNLNELQLQHKLMSEDRVDRTYDRLLEICPIISCKGSSKRVENGNKKLDILINMMN